jgi:hypothetical protein
MAKMRVHSIIKSNNEFYRNLNSEHGNSYWLVLIKDDKLSIEYMN